MNEMSGFDTQALVATLTDLVTTWGMRVIGALAVLIVGRMIAGSIRGTVRKLLAKGSVDATLVPFISNLVYYMVMAFVVVAVLGLFGIPTASVIAVLGAAGLAVGLALQGSLSNFASGVLIVAFRPYKVGDFIEGGGVSGVVEEVQIFSTIMRSGDNKKIIVPNSQMMAGEIVNYSANTSTPDT